MTLCTNFASILNIESINRQIFSRQPARSPAHIRQNLKKETWWGYPKSELFDKLRRFFYDKEWTVVQLDARPVRLMSCKGKCGHWIRCVQVNEGNNNHILFCMPGEITGSPTEARHIARATTG